jgi:putative ABC transport system permease protein
MSSRTVRSRTVGSRTVGSRTVGSRTVGSRTVSIRTGWRLATGGAGTATAAVGLLIFACVFLAVAGPREGVALRTRALQQSFSAQQPVQRTVFAAVDDTALTARLNLPSASNAALVTVQGELRGNLAGLHLPLAAASADWYGLTTALGTLSGYRPAAAPSGVAPQLELVYRGQLGQYATLAAGTLPATATQGARGTTLQIAVSTGTAATLGLRVGSRLGDGLGTTLVVTGIIRARSATSAPFWAADPETYAPVQLQTPAPGNLPYWTAAGFVGAGELAVLQKTMDPATTILGWDFPLDLSQVTAGQAQQLSIEFAQAGTLAGQIGTGGAGGITGMGGASPVTITEGVSSVLAGFTAQDTAAGAVLSLLSVSLAAVGIMVILAGAQLVAEQRRDELALRRARGGARWQIGVRTLAGMAAVTVPAAAGAVALAVALTAGYPDPLTWWLAGVTVLVALGGAPLIAVRGYRTAALPGSARPARPPRKRALRRLSAEALLIVLSAGGLVLLRQQGLGEQGGTLGAGGWYTSLAPVLVAVPAAIVVVRCYPLLLRVLLRVARSRPGVTAFVGFSRAVQNAQRAALPAFTLVLALTVVAFGTMIRDAVADGEVAASWQQVGADALINAGTSQHPLTAAAQRAIASVPGVRHAASVVVLYDSQSGTSFSLVAVDPAQYAALIGSTPGGSFAASRLLSWHGGGVPALASASYRALLGGGSGLLHTSEGALAIHVTGAVSSVPGVPGGGTLLVVPLSALPVPVAPLEELVTGPHLDALALRQVVARQLPGATVTLRSTVLASLTGAPLPHSAYLAITVGSAAAAALVVLVLLITVVLAARDGAPILARLRVMGLGRRQARWLEVAQMLPQVSVAAAGGLACACALAPLIGPSIDLSAFTGAGPAVPVRAQLVPLLAAAAGLLLLAIATVAVQNVLTARREQP